MIDSKQNIEKSVLIVDSDFYKTYYCEREDNFCIYFFQFLILSCFILLYFKQNIYTYILTIIIYFIYLLNHLYLNKWSKLIFQIKTVSDLFTQLFYNQPEIILESHISDSFSLVKRYNVPFYSSKDISGLISLKSPPNKKILHVKIYLETYFSDSISENDYNEQKRKFFQLYISSQSYLIERKNIKNFEFSSSTSNDLEALINLEPNNILFNKNMFIFFNLICLGTFYYLFLFHYLNKATNGFYRRDNLIIIRKVISTRNNVKQSQFIEKYNRINPLVIINDKIYTFEKTKSEYVSSELIPIKPDEKELTNVDENKYVKKIDLLLQRGTEIKLNEISINMNTNYLIRVDKQKNQFSICE